MARILVGTPTHDRRVHSTYARSLLALFTDAAVRQAGVELIPPDLPYGSLVDLLRNGLATRVLEDPAITHLLFVDSDIGFAPGALLALLRADKPVVGCPYPRRELQLERWRRLSRAVDDPRAALELSHAYVGGVLLAETIAGQSAVRVEGGLARVAQLGMGFTLIQRGVLEALAARYPELWCDAEPEDRARGVAGRLFQGFSPHRAGNGRVLGEDVSFCTRWVEGCGGELWACLTERLTHTGVATFAGRVMDQLRFTPPPDGPAPA